MIEEQEQGSVATASERVMDLARHALGADSGRPGYRNHFCASPGTADDMDWASMVSLGLARRTGPPREGLPYNSYAVSDSLRAHILENQHG